jgi:predicted metal-dependent hydrolase
MEIIAIKDLSILIQRSSRRKTVELSVERDGEIILYTPENVGREKLESLVLEKMLWIYRQLGRKEEELHNLPEKEFVSGEGFYYRGRKYKLKLLDEPVAGLKSEGRLRWQNGRFFLHRALAANGREAFVAWYGKRAEDWIPSRVQLLQGRVGVTPASINIRDLGFRWGSCTQNNKLFFHWRLMLLPIEQIDYLILHELVHLLEHNHSQAFYKQLRCAAPEYELHEEWLRRNGDRYAL